MNYYEKLSVRRVINAWGTMSFLGGSIMPEDVVEVWVNASKSFVHLDELQAKASETIARLTGAEAGLITAGADAGLTLAISACITGNDPEKYQRLPDTTGLKGEVLLPKICTNAHNFAFRVSGAKLIYVGTDGGFTEDDIDAAVNERTAAVAFVYFTDAKCGEDALKVAIRVAHKHRLPIIVDAAAETPPRENIRRLIKLGSDVVAYSGGKDIHGPNDTGILYGRKDIVEAARMQMRTLTPFGIGRSMKVGREDVAATVYALERYMNLDMEAYRAAWERRARSFIQEFGEHEGVQAQLFYPDAKKGEYIAQCFPRVHVILDEKALGVTAVSVAEALQEGNPRIMMPAGGNVITMNPHCLIDGEEKIIAQRLKEAIFSGAPRQPT